jgi:hypothetical protein
MGYSDTMEAVWIIQRTTDPGKLSEHLSNAKSRFHSRLTTTSPRTDEMLRRRTNYRVIDTQSCTSSIWDAVFSGISEESV